MNDDGTISMVTVLMAVVTFSIMIVITFLLIDTAGAAANAVFLQWNQTSPISGPMDTLAPLISIVPLFVMVGIIIAVVRMMTSAPDGYSSSSHSQVSEHHIANLGSEHHEFQQAMESAVSAEPAVSTEPPASPPQVSEPQEIPEHQKRRYDLDK